MTWMSGQRAPLPSSPGGAADTPDGCAAVQRDMDRLENWTNTLKGIRGNAKSCIWGGIVLGSHTCWGWKAALQRRTCESAMHPSQQRKPTAVCITLHQEEHCQQVTANDIAQSTRAVSICGDIENLTGNGPEQHVLADPP